MSSDENVSTKSALLSGSERVSANNGVENLNSFHGQQEGNGSPVQDLHEAQPLASGNTDLHGGEGATEF